MIAPRISAAVLTALLMLDQSCDAELAVVDFEPIPTVSGTFTSTPSPYAEDGVLVESMFDNGNLINTNIRLPDKAMKCGGNGFGTKFRVSLPSGRPFTMVSLEIAPFSGVAGTITFVGRKPDTSTVTQAFATGSVGTGTTRVFPSTFQDIVALEWASAGNQSNSAHIDDITVELPSAITVPSAITLTESAGTANLGITFNPPLARPASITWQAVAGTATHPADYGFGGATTGTVTVPAGSSQWSIPCSIVADTATEPMETFTMVFNTSSQHAWFPGNVATTVRIGNDDGVTSFAGWMTGHGLAGNDALAGADPNRDGISNIESWLLRLNPAGPFPHTWLSRRPAFLFDSLSRPALRFTVPTPLPTDVRMIFEEATDLSLPWSEQTRRTGFGTGSLWTGTGSGRVTETANGSVSRTISISGSQSSRQRLRAFVRMKYELSSGGGSS